MAVLSKNQKRLRSVEKKIRHSKPKNGSWDMEKIERLEKQREIIMNLIQAENKKKENNQPILAEAHPLSKSFPSAVGRSGFHSPKS